MTTFDDLKAAHPEWCFICGTAQPAPYPLPEHDWCKPHRVIAALLAKAREDEARIEELGAKLADRHNCMVHGPVETYPCLWCRLEDQQELEALVQHMVNRFLGWRLPEDFHPDDGISFKPYFNEHTPWPDKHRPMGTNLFDAIQAAAMIRYMLEGMPHE